jgi:flavorubredoxin
LLPLLIKPTSNASNQSRNRFTLSPLKIHQRWMPSNKAKNDWVQRVRKLDIDMMCPQHGRIFKGDNVKRFLDWFEALEVGLINKGSN